MREAISRNYLRQSISDLFVYGEEADAHTCRKGRYHFQGQSFNCSQSVLSAFAAQYGLDKETALKLASPFGGGVARRGEICGAVTGALLVLGLARGADKPAGKDEIYRLSQEFMRLFEEKHGTLLCRELDRLRHQHPGRLAEGQGSREIHDHLPGPGAGCGGDCPEFA